MSTISTDLELAISYLQQGNIVAIPTETVYGLAGNAENEQAIRKIYTMKNRPLNHPLIMHIAPEWDLGKWVSHIPDYAYRLMAHFWPGPLTLVMQNQPNNLSSLITAGQKSIALRCPNHPIAQTLLRSLGFPLVAPSANPFGKISPTTAEHVQQSFIDDELLIIDGGRCQVGIESTIVAAIDAENYEILRHGSISEQQIKAILPTQQATTASSIKAPGRLARHYQPEKPLFCFNDGLAIKQFCQQTSEPVYILSFAKLAKVAHHFYYQLPNSPEKVAFELYFQLRKADQSSAKLIAIELPPEQEQWQAIRERVVKAAQQ